MFTTMWLLLAGCWAPEIADLPAEPPEPPPAAETSAPTGQPSPVAQPSPSEQPPPLPVPASTEVLPTPDGLLPAVPFTAWTTDAPLTLVGPGGTRVAELSRAGVRVEVVQVLPARVRLVCSGCTGEQADIEGWLPTGHLRAARTPGGAADPLTAALKLRARWAGSADLPAGATHATMCRLIDRGYERDGAHVTYEDDTGRLVLELRLGAWGVSEVAITAAGPWDCRADGASPRSMGVR